MSEHFAMFCFSTGILNQLEMCAKKLHKEGTVLVAFPKLIRMLLVQNIDFTLILKLYVLFYRPKSDL